ncbi:MAG: hypothetical protein IJX47_00320 [Clostridia bacterium]|nr:hypothetical protein [Clostridia bacterium]
MRIFSVKKPEYINKTFRMPLELIRKLEIIARANDVSLNNLVMQCCEYALDNIEVKEEHNFKATNE